jgi:hypothetical protein
MKVVNAMNLYRGGMTVSRGTYWNPVDGHQVDMKDEGSLPGDGGTRYLRMPPGGLLVVAPVLGGMAGSRHRGLHHRGACRHQGIKQHGGEKRFLRLVSDGHFSVGKETKEEEDEPSVARAGPEGIGTKGKEVSHVSLSWR